MREVDQNQNGIIETEEFLQVKKKTTFFFNFLYIFAFLQLMSALNTGAVSTSHFVKAARIGKIKSNAPPERSGGGVQT